MSGRLIGGVIDCAAMALFVVFSAGLTWLVWY